MKIYEGTDGLRGLVKKLIEVWDFKKSMRAMVQHSARMMLYSICGSLMRCFCVVNSATREQTAGLTCERKI